MINIKEQIDIIDFGKNLANKDIVKSLIEAEMFNLCRSNYLYGIYIEKYKNEDSSDCRVWIKVRLTIESKKQISIFQLRPFIDKGVQWTYTQGFHVLEKTYYIGEEANEQVQAM